mgnify:CR=1 FL=1
MKKKILFSILGVVAITILTFGTTYAYFISSTNSQFSGEGASGVDTTLTLEKIYHASKLVPLDDSLIGTAISKANNKCIDKSGYEVCSLYKIVLENTVDSESLYGYIRTGSSTYITDNLKYQFFDSGFNALTDIDSLPKIANETVYFQKNETNYQVSIAGSTTYYLAIWLTDIKEEQSVDYSKKFSGYIGFESTESSGIENGKIEANFAA